MSLRALQNLVLVGACCLSVGLAAGGAEAAVVVLNDQGAPPPQAPPGPVDCLGKYMRNMQRCRELWCHTVDYWFFTLVDCEDEALEACEQQAWAAYLACLESVA